MSHPIAAVALLMIVLSALMAALVWRAVNRHNTRTSASTYQTAGGNALFLRSSELYYWALDTVAGVVKRHLHRPPSPETAINMSRELHDATTIAMLPCGAVDDDINRIPCPATGQGIIGATAPEILELADYIQKNLSPERTRDIHLRAARNLEALSRSSTEGLDATQILCPLQGSDGICSAYPARPLRCRPLHAEETWRQLGLKQSINAECDHDARVVEQGAEEGLTYGLRSAGRESQLYELNSALLIALDTPNAAERWANGEEIFHDCRRCS